MPNFKNFLKKVAPGVKIKVGTKEGSSFFYMGYAEDMLEHMGEYNAINDKMWRDKLERAEKALKNTIKNDPTLRAYIDTQTKESILDLSLDGWNNYLDNTFKKIIMLKKRVDTFTSIEKFHDVLSVRKVIDTHMADPVTEKEPCMIIIIEGKETGRLWSTDEAPTLPIIGYDVF